MQFLLDKLILLFLCAVLLAQKEISVSFIGVLLIAISASALSFAFERRFSRVIHLAYTVAALFFPPLSFFIPLISYDAFFEKSILFKCLWMIPLVVSIVRGENVFLVLLLFLLAGISFYLWWRGNIANFYKEAYTSLQDDSSEFSLNTQKERRTLLEKRDYEIRLATLNERNRIAREIHDNVGHLLTRALLQIGALEIVNKDPDSEKSIVEVKTTLSTAMDSIRKSVHDLHDEAFDLSVQMQKLTEAFTFCPVRLEYNASDTIPRDMKYCFLSILQEALSNIARHSSATEASVVFREQPGFFQLIIKNDRVSLEKTAEKGIGLMNMQERVRSLSGTFHVQKGENFSLFITIPKEGNT